MGKIFRNFFDSIVNIFIFLPYYFSVPALYRTLFSPWKNLIAKKTQVGFSFGEWASRLSFNLISRTLGFLTRVFTLAFFVLCETLLVVVIPFFIILLILFSPLLYLFDLLSKSPEEKIPELKKNFVQSHTLNPKNLTVVDKWFENLYQIRFKKRKWWDLDNLFSIPPLARDWAVGYTPTLDKYCEEITSPSYRNRVRYAIGRDYELMQVQQILSKTEGANVLIVGEEGVGKKTIIDSFAKRVYEGKTNSLLNYKRILKINLEAILTENTEQKKREYFLEQLLTEAIEAKNIILVIEDIEKYISAGEDLVDLTIPIEKAVSHSDIHIIATTTPFNFEKFIYKKERINQLFVKIDVEEVSAEKALEILLDLVPNYENKYKIVIPYETAQNTVEKSEFYITHIPFPEKAIEILDTACAYSIQNQKKKVLPEDIDNVLSQITHAPTHVDESTKKTLIDFEKILSERIIGQNEAIKELSAALRHSFVLLGKRKKPLASFLFLGPTGVGKTETAKVLAEIFFKDSKHLIRFDMSLYQSKEDIGNLIGSMIYNNPGLLTQAVRDKPYAVLLLDEIEKANKDLLNIFLTILDEGYFKDGLGKNVDCKNLAIIATSNAGSDFIYKNLSNSNLQRTLIDYLIEKDHFSPEFLNRFDGVIAFNSLSKEAVLAIAKKMVEKLSQNYQKSHNVSISIADQTIAEIVNESFSSQFGARNLERVILSKIQDIVNKRILEGNIRSGEVISV